jgi:hypothetical protein
LGFVLLLVVVIVNQPSRALGVAFDFGPFEQATVHQLLESHRQVTLGELEVFGPQSGV